MSAETIKCTGCGYSAKLNCGDDRTGRASVESAARVKGWRIFTGETVAGAAVDHRLCPVCAGTATPEQRQKIGGWDAHCDTCDASMTEEWADERDEDDPFTEKDARGWRDDHQCEPDVSLIRPVSAAPVGVA